MSAACLQAGLLCVSASCIRPGTEIRHRSADVDAVHPGTQAQNNAL